MSPRSCCGRRGWRRPASTACCSSPPMQSPTRSSTPRTQRTCGTWSTARTGRSASPCSGACPRAPTPMAGSPPWRTRVPTSAVGCCLGSHPKGASMSEDFEYVVIGLGALGSATAYELARRGHRVLGLERFPLCHNRGASHDTSRILRHSYHTPGYVHLTLDAYEDWARLEEATGEQLMTVVGGLDLFPVDAAIPMVDYTTSLDEVDVCYSLLDTHDIAARWPQFSLPSGTVGLYQSRGAIVPAGRGTRLMQELAVARGAVLRDESPVTSVVDLGPGGIEVSAGGESWRCAR